MKLLLIFIISAAILTIVVVLYCTLVISGRSNECAEKLFYEQICPKCQTGKYTYELDPEAGECPHIFCCKNGKCPFYIPLDSFSSDDK